MCFCTGPHPRPVLFNEQPASTQRPLIPAITPPPSRVLAPSLDRVDPTGLGIILALSRPYVPQFVLSF